MVGIMECGKTYKCPSFPPFPHSLPSPISFARSIHRGASPLALRASSRLLRRPSLCSLFLLLLVLILFLLLLQLAKQAGYVSRPFEAVLFLAAEGATNGATEKRTFYVRQPMAPRAQPMAQPKEAVLLSVAQGATFGATEFLFQVVISLSGDSQAQ
eukprot:518999-Pyramimonas_sp.AAC.2